jgi:hypothetical protein
MAQRRDRVPVEPKRGGTRADGDPMAITETERPVVERAIDPPFALVYDVVRRAAREREAGREDMRRRLDATHERYTGLAADSAVALHELRGCLEGEPVPAVLASIARRFATALDRAGVRFDDPVGEAYAAVGRRVDVAHAPDEGDEARMIVAKTLRPGVLLDDGEVIRRAQVVLGFVPTAAQREGAANARGEAATAAVEDVPPAPGGPRPRRGKGRGSPRDPKADPGPAAGFEPERDPAPQANGTRPAEEPTRTTDRTGEERTDNEGGTTG